MAYRGKMPSIEAIVEAQRHIWSRCLIDMHPAKECWACGAGRSDEFGAGGAGGLERAHIVAHRDGGTMEPTNFFVLCGICHGEQPDDAPLEDQVFWLVNHEAQIDRCWRKGMAWGRAIVAGVTTEEQAIAMARRGIDAPAEFHRG